MIKVPVTIINKLGLHARAAAKLVTLASHFSSEIILQRGDNQVNGKSIMGVMMLAAGQGTELTLQADGDDEEQAIEELKDLIAKRFGEDE
ncbi:MAG: HPr family phosphocarrier protein [gamma proteobacterium symbiont of Bathyaustriella thionipta]|nr:HPr family phosphocarrier protein [gamma proteobacterium symbiont of Bathyaustriella thionipta]